MVGITNETVTASALTLGGSSAGNYQLNPVVAPANIGTITAVPLTITANDATSLQGDPLPTFTATSVAFVPGDSPSVLTGPLIFTVPATSSSPAGIYSITPSGVSDPNYQIQFVAGTLTSSVAAWFWFQRSFDTFYRHRWRRRLRLKHRAGRPHHPNDTSRDASCYRERDFSREFRRHFFHSPAR